MDELISFLPECYTFRSFPGAVQRMPFILVKGAVSDEFAVCCIKRGADDYFLKSNLGRLPSAIRNALKHKSAEESKLVAINSLAA